MKTDLFSVFPKGCKVNPHVIHRDLCPLPLPLPLSLLLLLPLSVSAVGGLAQKSQNHSQMNLSGSSSSLTSDASTKAVSLRSYGIGEAGVSPSEQQEQRRAEEEKEEKGEEKRERRCSGGRTSERKVPTAQTCLGRRSLWRWWSSAGV